ncbi:MAG: type II toxin-antitoxin system VapB family antitoxin [Cyanobacteria bacterium]|nr:type II toxin-antitoxin system VapB family antitoxin [Cyanobacteriota bacterium]
MGSIVPGGGATEIVREALERELQRQRRIRRSARLQQELSPLQDQAADPARPFDASELYGADGLPG